MTDPELVRTRVRIDSIKQGLVDRTPVMRPWRRPPRLAFGPSPSRTVDSLSTSIAALHKQYGRIDAVVNNVYPRNAADGRKFEDVTYADFCQNVSIHGTRH